MSKYGIIVNADDCVGCHACFVACKEENQVAPGVKWNHLERLEHPAEEVIEYFRVSCMHCENRMDLIRKQLGHSVHCG